MATRYEKLEIDNPVGFECDVCGKQMSYCGHVSGKWGYDSSKDGISEECDLCEECFDKVLAFLKTLNANVKVTESY